MSTLNVEVLKIQLQLDSINRLNEVIAYLNDNNAMLVGSRYFGTAKENSDWDFMLPHNIQHLNNLLRLGGVVIVDNINKQNYSGDRNKAQKYENGQGIGHRYGTKINLSPLIDNDYGDKFTQYVIEFKHSDELKIQVQLTQNYDTKKKIYEFVKKTNTATLIPNKNEFKRYFVNVCNFVYENWLL